MLDQHAASDPVENLCVFRFHARALARGENQNSEIFHRLFLSIGRIWGTDPEFLLLQNSGSVPRPVRTLFQTCYLKYRLRKTIRSVADHPLLSEEIPFHQVESERMKAVAINFNNTRMFS